MKRICEQCGREKELDEFHRHGNMYRKGEHMSMCKGCYKTNREETVRKLEEQRKATKEEKARRAQEAEASLSEEGRAARQKLEMRKQHQANLKAFALAYQAREGKPSIVTSQDGWIFAHRQHSAYPDETERDGKWMVFPATEEVDAVWGKIEEAVREGLLGDEAKVAPSPLRGKVGHVICIYTYDSDDKTDLLRILTRLRALGINHHATYKENRETQAGNYAGVASMWSRNKRTETTRSPVKWYAREGRIELLTPKNYTPFDPVWLECLDE